MGVLFDFALIITIVIAFFVGIIRLGNIVNKLQSIENYFKQFQSTGYGGMITQEQLEELLPEYIDCPKCNENMLLNLGNRIYKKYKCPYCSGKINMNT